MAKKIMGSFKLQLKAGQATMSPPVGPAFGQRGLNGMQFVKEFNAKTSKDGDMIIPALITFFSDKSFSFVLKSPPAAVLLAKAAGLPGGSSTPNKVKVGKVTVKQVEDIAKTKMQDLNCDSMESAISMISGTARSMGIVVEG